MGGLDIIETNIIPKSIKNPEIDTSYVFRPFTRHPKLIRAVIEEQTTPKPTKKHLNDSETQYNLSVYFDELDKMYKFQANSKHVNPPKCDIKQIEFELNSKLISRCIRETWTGNTTNQTNEETLSTPRSWNHEDALAEAKKLIATWNYVFKYTKPSL
jgi:hypothetical protein